MRDILRPLREWYDSGRTVALATVVGMSGSAPRAPGAAMAVSADGEVLGSVSGGCVEAAVYALAAETIRTRVPALQTYGYSEADVFAVGLICGGTVEVFVAPVSREASPQLGEVMAAIEADERVALATLIDGAPQIGARLAIWPDRTSGGLGDPGLDAAVRDDARGLLEQGTSGLRRYGPAGAVTVFLESFTPPARMLVFGAIDFAAALVRHATMLGYRVTVCDARPVFTTRARFPDADEVVVDWPHRYLARTTVDSRTVICVLTHDPKFDVPLLTAALRTPAAYIGAMGSRRTHAERLAELRAAGLTDAELDRLRAPIGLDLGARTPAETAVAIGAEIIAVRSGGTGRPLAETSGPIHRRTS